MHHYAVDEFRDWKYRDHLGLTLGNRPAASFAKRLMVTTVADGLGHAAMAVQGVGGDGQAIERQQFEPRDRGMHLAALLRHGLGQAHERVAAKDGHRQRRHMRAALGIDASEALAVDGDLAFGVSMRACAPKAAMKRTKASLRATESTAAIARLKVSWLGAPRSSGMNWRDKSSRFLQLHLVQCVAPQSTAASATNKICGNGCCAVKSRGSEPRRRHPEHHADLRSSRGPLRIDFRTPHKSPFVVMCESLGRRVPSLATEPHPRRR